MRALHWISLALLGFAIVSGAWHLLRRQESAALRAEIASLEQENRRLADLRAEHERLLAGKVSDSDLERLRNDRAALQRLRAEINQLNESADRKARALREPAADKLPALVLKLALANDGGLLFDGEPAHDLAIRELFAQLARKSERVDIRFQVDANDTRSDLLKEKLNEIARWAKDARLGMSFRLERTGTGTAQTQR
jgi:hypothetical protein